MRGEVIILETGLAPETCAQRMGKAIAGEPVGWGVGKQILARTLGPNRYELWRNPPRQRNDFAPSLLLTIEPLGAGARLACRLDFSPNAALFAKGILWGGVVIGAWALVATALGKANPVLGVCAAAAFASFGIFFPKLAYDSAKGDEQELLAFVKHTLGARPAGEAEPTTG